MLSSDVVRRVADVVELRYGVQPPASEPDGCDVPVLAQRSVGAALPERSRLETVRLSPTIGGPLLRPGDLVLTSRADPIRAAIADDEHEGLWVSTNLIVARPRSDELSLAVLAAFLRHPATAQRLLRRSAGGTVPGFGLKDLGALEIVVPDRRSQEPLERAIRAAARVEALAARAVACNALLTQGLALQALAVSDS